MEIVVEGDPDQAWAQAGRTDILVVPYEAKYAEEEWSELVERWDESTRLKGRASVFLFVDQDGRASIRFNGNGRYCFAKDRLGDRMARLLEDTVDGRGYADGVFGDWSTIKLPFSDAIVLAQKVKDLDRYARNPKGAEAYEDGRMAQLVWNVHER